MFQIGQVLAKNAVVAGPFIWTPPDPTIATQIGTLPNGKKYGHFCLLTRVECTQDPIHWVGGDWHSLARDNNLGVRNLSVAEPEITLPLTLNTIKKARKSIIRINTINIPEDVTGWFMIPKKMLKRIIFADGRSKGKLKIVQPKAQHDFVHIGIPGRIKLDIDNTGSKKTIIRFWYKKRDVDKKIATREPVRGRIYITQYADGVEVGGMAFDVR